jgi:hypothetical protein
VVGLLRFRIALCGRSLVSLAAILRLEVLAPQTEIPLRSYEKDAVGTKAQSWEGF